MRIQQNDSSFRPVTITLDSQQEVETFYQLLTVAYGASNSGSDEEMMADEMRDNFRNNIGVDGWQSSSANC